MPCDTIPSFRHYTLIRLTPPTDLHGGKPTHAAWPRTVPSSWGCALPNLDRKLTVPTGQTADLHGGRPPHAAWPPAGLGPGRQGCGAAPRRATPWWAAATGPPLAAAAASLAPPAACGRSGPPEGYGAHGWKNNNKWITSRGLPRPRLEPQQELANRELAAHRDCV